MSLQQNIRCLASISYVLLRQRGATSIEYALLSALIAVVILVAVGNTGLALSNIWSNIATQVSAAL